MMATLNWRASCDAGRCALSSTTFLPFDAMAQAADHPDLTGVWGTLRAGRGGGGDPKLAAPPPTPLVFKPEYAKPYEEKRAREAEARKRGEQLVNGSVQCVPYGVPTMMSIAHLSGGDHPDAQADHHHLARHSAKCGGCTWTGRRTTSTTWRRVITDVPWAAGRAIRWWWIPSASSPRSTVTGACRTANRCASPSDSTWWPPNSARPDHHRRPGGAR